MMLKEFKNTLTKVIHLRSIIGYNGLVFALKKTPLIGKLLPDALYRTTALKVIYWIFHVIKEVFLLFIGKIFGLGMIYLASYYLSSLYIEYDKVQGISQARVYSSFALFLFIIYALCGLLINTSVFRCTTEKEYLVFMLRMNARKLNNTLLIYDLSKLVIGYLIASIVAVISGAPFWLWLGIPVLAVFMKLFGAGVQASSFRRRFKHNRSLKISATGLIIRICIVLFAFPVIIVIIANGYYFPLPVLLAVSGIFILLGIWGFIELKDFDSKLHRRALRDNIAGNNIGKCKEPDTTRQFKRLKATGSVKGDKKGFEYLNALFVRRHRKILAAKPVVFVICVAAVLGIIFYGFISSYYESFGSVNCVKMVFGNILNMLLFRHYEDALRPFESSSASEFFRYLASNHLLGLLVPISIADISFKATQAFYINCDNSLMTYSFFKQREKIIKLFDIRLKQLFKINVVVVITVSFCTNLILFYTGGQDYPFQYIFTFVIASAISIIYSITCLALYYLFQPFTTTVNVKGGAYMAARTILAVISGFIFWIPVNSLILVLILTVFTVLYVFFVRKLVYKKAPETWKIKV